MAYSFSYTDGPSDAKELLRRDLFGGNIQSERQIRDYIDPRTLT